MTARREFLGDYSPLDLVQFVAPCPRCGGRGHIADERTPGSVKYQPCEECNGTGLVVTAVETAEGDE